MRNLTDAEEVLSSSIARFLTMNVITLHDSAYRNRKKRMRIGKVKSSFINISEITSDYEQVIEAQKENIEKELYKSDTIRKYTHDLFYISPLYPMKFKNLSKLIFLDADVVFQESIVELWSEFDEQRSGECISLGKDLSPHYYHQIYKYRDLHPESEVGLPGDKQGFNTGVVLYDLECLRSSKHLEKLLNPNEVNNNNKKYLIPFNS